MSRRFNRHVNASLRVNRARIWHRVSDENGAALGGRRSCLWQVGRTWS